jgi:hypothetical protein
MGCGDVVVCSRGIGGVQHFAIGRGISGVRLCRCFLVHLFAAEAKVACGGFVALEAEHF